MTTSSYSAPAPDASLRIGITTQTIGDPLWKKVLLEAGPLEIQDSCEQILIFCAGVAALFFPTLQTSQAAASSTPTPAPTPMHP
ncbi:MAG: hypothetical protein WAO00_04290 [Chthoniobacterales bacterium]